ncbi:MAG: hypothetical protein JXM70_11460 [Pirellulales bacterium]|nr:hypothetical protein [Pirellulales bacterium]
MTLHLLRASLCVVLLTSCTHAQAADAKPGLKTSKGITALLTPDGKIEISNAPSIEISLDRPK